MWTASTSSRHIHHRYTLGTIKSNEVERVHNIYLIMLSVLYTVLKANLFIRLLAILGLFENLHTYDLRGSWT